MLRTLELQNIRSYESGLFEFKPGVNIIVGPNASGKTNLLEAVHMMAQGAGFKSSDADMIRRGSDWGRIDALTESDTRTVKLSSQTNSKVFVIGDVEKKRLSTSTIIPVVLFEPSHMLLLGGEPERRRSYIDGILSQVEPRYARSLNEYKRALAQRNRLLKQESVSPEHVFVWDLRLSELSGVVAQHRDEYVRVVNKDATSNYRSVSGNKERLEVFYDSKLPIKSYAEAHLQRLKQDFELDRMRGFTGSGPHRDDIAIHIDGVDARLTASRGETRSIVLALKMTELSVVRERASAQPLLLLDDVFSELDGRRRRLLAEALQDTQTLITTTDADAIVQHFMGDYNIVTIGSSAA